MTWHRHLWRTLADPAMGVFSKRGSAIDEVQVSGRAEACRCGAGRFVPTDHRLRIVDIEWPDLPTRDHTRYARVGA